MIAEKIQTAAELFADKIDDGVRTARQCSILAYRQGAREGIKILWHDICEIPHKGVPVYLMTARKKKLKLYSCDDVDKFKKFCSGNGIARWAYREDIIGI